MSTMVQASGGGGKGKLELECYDLTKKFTTSQNFPSLHYSGIGCYCDDMEDPYKYGLLTYAWGSYANNELQVINNQLEVEKRVATDVYPFRNYKYFLQKPAGLNYVVSILQYTVQPSAVNSANIQFYWNSISEGSSSSQMTISIRLYNNRKTNTEVVYPTGLYIFKKPDSTSNQYPYKVFISYYFLNSSSNYVSELAVLDWTGEFTTSAFYQSRTSCQIDNMAASANDCYAIENPGANYFSPFVIKVNGKKMFMLPIVKRNNVAIASFLYAYDIANDILDPSDNGAYKYSFTDEFDVTRVNANGYLCEDADNNIFLGVNVLYLTYGGKMRLCEYQYEVSGSGSSTHITRKILNQWIINDFSLQDTVYHQNNNVFITGYSTYRCIINGKKTDLSGYIVCAWNPYVESLQVSNAPLNITFKHVKTLIPIETN